MTKSAPPVQKRTKLTIDELLCCPFCGANAAYFAETVTHQNKTVNGWYVACADKSGCNGGMRSPRSYFATEQSVALRWWNLRADDFKEAI